MHNFSIDPATAKYPTHDDRKPNQARWKFGFPVFYVTDLLQLTVSLICLSCRWLLEYAGKTWVDFGDVNQPNEWVTLRALRVLKQAEGYKLSEQD